MCSSSGSLPSISAHADEFVERVVPADVFAHRHQLAGRVEKRRGVQAAGRSEHALRGAQRSGNAEIVRGATCRDERTGARPRSRSASMLALPHTPHALVIVKWRSSALERRQHRAVQVDVDDVVALLFGDRRGRCST